MIFSSATAGGEIDVKKLPKFPSLRRQTPEMNFTFHSRLCYEEESAGYENGCRCFVCSVKQLSRLEVPGKRSWKLTKVAKQMMLLNLLFPTGVAQPFLKRAV